MAVTVTNRQNLGASGLIEIIDGLEFEGFGSGGFSENDFHYIGDAENDIIQADIGNDEIEGEDGNDELKGGDGNDIIDGDSGDDDLDGQGGTDKLFGGAGNDILRGGHGHDQMFGGLGNDTFGFYALGFYRVHDFTVGEDRLFFDADKTGIDSVPELLDLITTIESRDDDGFTVYFGDPGNPAAWIDVVGVNIHEITADMVVFHV